MRNHTGPTTALVGYVVSEWIVVMYVVTLVNVSTINLLVDVLTSIYHLTSCWCDSHYVNSVTATWPDVLAVIALIAPFQVSDTNEPPVPSCATVHGFSTM